MSKRHFYDKVPGHQEKSYFQRRVWRCFGLRILVPAPACLGSSVETEVRLGAMDTGEQGMAVTFVVGRLLDCTHAVCG